MERFRLGTTRIVVASDCFTWGVDVPDIRNVILFGLPSSFSKLVQQIGRAGRDKKQAYAITYTPPWVKEIPDKSRKGTKVEAAELKRRDNMCPILRHWFNPTSTSCLGMSSVTGLVTNHLTLTTAASYTPKAFHTLFLSHPWLQPSPPNLPKAQLFAPMELILCLAGKKTLLFDLVSHR